MHIKISPDLEQKLQEAWIEPSDLVAEVLSEWLILSTKSEAQRILDKKNQIVSDLVRDVEKYSQSLDLAIKLLYVLDLLDKKGIKSSPKHYQAANDYAWRSDLFRLHDRYRPSSIPIWVNWKVWHVTWIKKNRVIFYKNTLRRLFELAVYNDISESDIRSCLEL